MPSRLINNQNGMCTGGNLGAVQLQVLAHSMSVGPRHDQPGSLASCRTERAKDVRSFRPLIVWRMGPGATAHPSAGDLVLLPHPRFILEPNLYRRPAVPNADVADQVGEVFFESLDGLRVLRIMLRARRELAEPITRSSRPSVCRLTLMPKSSHTH